MTAPSAGTPKVTVVIPTVRGGAYLRAAIDSVLDQTMRDFELIVVADGCEDDLADLEGGDPRVRVLRQPNRGKSVARNVGVRASRSELIAFLDDDDRMLPRRLSAQLAGMEGRADVGLCHTQYRVIDGSGRPQGLGHADDVQYLDLLRGRIHVCMPTTMMRKSVLEEVGGFDPTLHTGEDLDVIYRVARESRVALVPDVLTEYRRHAANASGDVLEGARNVRRLLTKLRRLEEQCGRRQEAAAAAEGIRWASRYGATGAILAARAARLRRDRPAAIRNVGLALRLSPLPTVGDLIGNRAPLRRVRDRLGRPGRIGRAGR